jgi:tape measure domain-containing protein
VAEYNVDIQVRAKTRQAESEITKLQKILDDLSRKSANINFGTVERSVRGIGATAKNVGTEIKNIFSRGLFAGAILGAGQLSSSIEGVISKYGFLGKSVATSLNSALGGIPEIVGNILTQVGHIPNSLGLAAVAAMAFAPQLLKASSAAAGLGAAVDKAVGKQVTENIAGTIGQINNLKTAVDTAKTSFADLIKGSTLNQLNAQLKDANYQIGEYHSTTQDARIAAQQLAAVIKEQRKEQQAITTLVREAQGLRSEDVERRATNTYNVIQRRKKFLAEEAKTAADTAQEIRRLEQAESEAARTRLAEAAKNKADALLAEAAAAQQALTATRNLEQAESQAARSRLAASAQTAQERAAFLAGGQISAFPFGPSPRSTRRRFDGDVSPERAESALQARERKAQRALNLQFFEEERLQLAELDRIRDQNATRQTARIQKIGKVIRGSLSSAAIGGAFPLLFGQSPQAALGGAIGGLLGGQAGGFAGSLIGTALGDIEATKARVKELGLELGFSSVQAKELSAAFQLAGRDSQQLEAAVINIQGLGLSTNETASAIKIAVELSKEYGGSVSKVAQAFADTLESGKVSISTLNKFTAQGIPIQQELADKLGVSRTKLLQMAKDGEISVQQLTDTLVEMGRQAAASADKGATGFDRFTKAVAEIASAVAGAAGAIIRNLIPALDSLLLKLAAIINRATKAINLITDATVGEAASAVALTAGERGSGFASKSGIDRITKGLNTLNPLLATSREELEKIAKVAGNAKVELSKYGGELGEYSVRTAQVQLSRVETAILKRRRQLGAPSTSATIENIQAPVNLPPSAKAAGGGAEKSALANSIRRTEVLKRETDTLFLASTIQDKINAAERIGADQLALRLTYERDRAKIIGEYSAEEAKVRNTANRQEELLGLRKKRNAELVGLTLNYENQLFRLQQGRLAAGYDQQTQLQQEAYILQQTLIGKGEEARLEVDIANAVKDKDATQAAGIATQMRRNAELTREVETQQRLNSLIGELGNTTMGVFEDLIFVTNSWQQSLAGALQMMSMTLIRFGLSSLADMGDPTGQGVGLLSILTGRFGKRAAGGPVSAGSPYLVGERGPELFMPRTSGSIYPNDAMGMGGANIVVNVDAGGSSVGGDPGQANQLGKAIGIAVQQELIKQKRPGGLLA